MWRRSCGRGSGVRQLCNKGPRFSLLEFLPSPRTLPIRYSSTSTNTELVHYTYVKGEVITESEIHQNKSDDSSPPPSKLQVSHELRKTKAELTTTIGYFDRFRRWMGPGGKFEYLKDMSSFPEETKSVSQRRFLNRDESAAVGTTHTTPAEREKSASQFRAGKAKEAAATYKKSTAEKMEDFKRPLNLDGWAGLAEARIRENMADPERGIVTLSPTENLTSIDSILQDAQNDAFIGGSSRILNRMLEKSGACPQWVEIDKEIKRLMESFRSDMKRIHRDWRKKASPVDSFPQSNSWEVVSTLMEGRLKTINARIVHYNLIVPHLSMQKWLLTLPDELVEAGQVASVETASL